MNHIKANMTPEIEALLTRLGVNPDNVVEVDIKCDGYNRPEVSVKMKTTIPDEIVATVVTDLPRQQGGGESWTSWSKGEGPAA